MNVGIYKGAAAMNSLERWQAAISQNLASANITGYRKNEMSFSGVMGELTKVSDPSASGAGKKSPLEVRGVMPSVENRMNFQPGQYISTGNEFHFAIEGPGFFRVRRQDGTFGFTRNGSFRMNEDRVLVTEQGFEVQGDNGPVQFLQQGGTLSINADGMIVQGQQQISRLGVVDFADPSVLRRGGDGLLVSDGPQGAAIERPRVVHRALEGSNVQPVKEMINLVTVGRAYEMAQKVIQAHDEVANKAVQVLGAPTS
jgi:flagellar basal-body rod protein FlgG